MPARLSTAARLALAFGAIVIVIAAAGGAALGALVRGDAALQAQAQRDARELELALQLQAAALAALSPATPAPASPANPATSATPAALAEPTLQRYAGLREQLQALPPAPQAEAERAALDAAAARARLALLPPADAGADAVADAPPVPATDTPAALQAWVQALQSHTEAVRRAALAQEQGALETRATLQRVLAAALVGAAALAALLGLWAVRGLRRELGTDPGQLKAAAERLGQGELYHALDRRDARDSVVDAFDRMREALAALALAVRHAAHDTAGAGQQLAAGQDELRGRVDQQAAALQQALATVQALGTALRRGAEEARQAGALAEELQGLAGRGGAAMAAAFDGLRELQQDDHRLAALGQAVEAVAFQARLLAVNAGLEAARSGATDGPGAAFSSQARELAQRCADTARELRARAAGQETAAAQRVQALAAQADAALQSLGGAAGRLARSGAGLDLLAREQAEDAERIDRTLLALDQATRQTALTAERNAAAAQALRTHSGQLLDALSPLKPLPGSGPEIAPAPLGWAAPPEALPPAPADAAEAPPPEAGKP